MKLFSYLRTNSPFLPHWLIVTNSIQVYFTKLFISWACIVFQSFDSIKEELRLTRNKNAHKKRNFYKKSNSSENFDFTKRETNENNRGTGE